MITHIEKMKQEIVEYDLHHMTIEELLSAAKRGIRQSLDKSPLSVVEWRHEAIFGESYD
jgi:hypothetical protein